MIRRPPALSSPPWRETGRRTNGRDDDEGRDDRHRAVRRRIAGDRVPPRMPRDAASRRHPAKAQVLSTVSGGSVIGAMYAVHDGDFAELRGRGAIRPRVRPSSARPCAPRSRRRRACAPSPASGSKAWRGSRPSRRAPSAVWSARRREPSRTAASVRQPDDDPRRDDGRPPVRRPQAVRPRRAIAPPRHGRLRAPHGLGLLLRAQGRRELAVRQHRPRRRSPWPRRSPPRRPIPWHSPRSTRT